MPCEGCRVQFTVFRRKRVCTDCKRFYCNTCLTVAAERLWAGDVLLCERCSIFAKRPLLRTDLLQLKPKDLIFYLQSKHISTAGCVEKDELICLVLNYAQQADTTSASSGSNGGRRDRRRSSSSGANKNSRLHGDTTNSFLNLKQSCQNFFTNITDNISDSLSSFEQRTTPKPRSQSSSRGPSGSTSPTSRPEDSPSHISDQPRVSTRELPSYASCQQQPPGASSARSPPPPEAPPILTVRLGPEAEDTPTHMPASSSSSSQRQRSSADTSPVMSSTSSSANSSHPRDLPRASAASCEAATKWECECSGPKEDGDDDDDDDDDEIIATYTSGKRQASGDKESPVASEEASAARHQPGEAPKMPAAADAEVSSQSSFDELGAIGGISDDSKTTTDTNSSNLDQWQMLDMQRDGNAAAEEHPHEHQEAATNAEASALDEVPSVSGPPRPSSFRLSSERHKKITRRRSDSYLKKKRPPSDEDESPTTSEQVLRRLAEESNRLGMTGDSSSQATAAATTNSEPEEPPKTPQRQCKRCGKSKLNIRRQVEKMRRHLESSQMSEADIKDELREFLVYLERRTKSVDYSEDSETAASSAMGQHYTPDSEALAAAASIAAAFAAVVDPDGYSELDDDEGINVYATPAGFNGNRRDSRFIQLEDYETMEELENLSVKQLKEVLMLNRVDYKGCCEKQELLERVERLWKNLKSTPAIEKLQTDELCKICMDAPIECVILECGHMATCTNCGKVLSECPICRQYIVRVVRFFRA